MRHVLARAAQSLSTKSRLTAALSTLTKDEKATQFSPTVTTLCRLARVSRNTLYRFYPEIGVAVRLLRRRRTRGSRSRATVVRALRSKIGALRAQVTRLAALVDHYHAAAEELRLQLERRERKRVVPLLRARRGS
jgi:hypothetical protein